MQVQPYLFFNGRCDEAIEFYKRALGAEVEMVMRYKDSPEPTPPGMTPPNWGDKIMHASMRVGETTVMASDGGSSTPAKFGDFSLSLSPANAAGAQKLFRALSDGGSVQMPLGKTFWSPAFAMLTDRFGVKWMINATAA
jgi:PhnB protein